ncbi:F-box/RNI-like superfamily protein [Wolffia australiana]
MVERGSGKSDLDFWFKNLILSSGVAMTGMISEMTGWKDLPMELLLRIISLTDNRTAVVASGVCTGWREALGAGLTHLSLSWCKNNMNSLLLSLAPKFTKLRVLSLRQNKPQLEDDAVECVATHCRDLRDLDLSKSLKLRDCSLYALAHGCPNLTTLNISGCSAFSDTALAYLVTSCRNLKSLNLCGCVRASSDRALQAIARSCQQLQCLNLGWCEGVTDKGVMALAFGCPDLRNLDLCGCVLITDESVVALAEGCPRLRSLDLYYCQNITDRAMYSLARRAGPDGSGLVNLNISQCTALTPPAVQAVCDSYPSLHTCPGQHSLIISGCLSLTTVHCACAVHSRRPRPIPLSHRAH